MKTSINTLVRKTRAFLMVGTLTALGSLPLQAAPIVSWNLNSITTGDLSAPASFEASEVIPGVVLSVLGGGTGGWPNTISTVQNSAAVNSLATAISAGDYFSFSVSPDAMHSFSYDHLDIIYSIGTNNALNSQTTFTLLSDATGFTALDAIDSFNSPVTSSNIQGLSSSFDLSGTSELQDVTGAVEFRIYFYNTDTTTYPNPMVRIAVGRGFNTSVENDLVLDGSIAPVPEPGVVTLLGLSLAGLLIRRRRVRG